MFQCDWSTFVVQRRVNRPFDQVARTIANPAIFGRDCVVSSSERASLRLETPFRSIDVYAGCVWRADATLRDARNRTIAAVEIEIGAWTATVDSELVLRPTARHPERWSGRRLRRYFDGAHRGADDVAALLRDTTLKSTTQNQESPNAPTPRVLSAPPIPLAGRAR